MRAEQYYVANDSYFLLALCIVSTSQRGASMSAIKIISYPNLSSVEDTFNAWVSSSQFRIISTHFNVSRDEGELWYSILIYYESESDE